MSESSRITETAYEPEDDEFRETVSRFHDELEIDPHTETTVGDSESNVGAVKEEFTLSFEGSKVEGQLTFATTQYSTRLRGSLGLSAAAALAYSQRFGVPTQAFVDRPKSGEATTEDLCVDWYGKEYIEMGMPEQRLEDSPIDIEREEIDLETLEHYARTWLSLDEE